MGENPLRSKLASRPVASVAIHRATGGCEAYTARKQAVKIPLRNYYRGDADVVEVAEGSIWDDRNCEGRTEIAGVASSGHVSKGIPQEPRRARHPRSARAVTRSPRDTRGGHEPVDEQSYEPIVPRKVGKRRAPPGAATGPTGGKGGTGARICRKET